MTYELKNCCDCCCSGGWFCRPLITELCWYDENGSLVNVVRELTTEFVLVCERKLLVELRLVVLCWSIWVCGWIDVWLWRYNGWFAMFGLGGCCDNTLVTGATCFCLLEIVEPLLLLFYKLTLELFDYLFIVVTSPFSPLLSLFLL